jgi:hypothetical protein
VRRIFRQHHHLGPDVNPAEQIRNIFIGEADAT